MKCRLSYSSYLILESLFNDIRNVQNSICLDICTKLYFQMHLQIHTQIVSCFRYRRLLWRREKESEVKVGLDDYTRSSTQVRTRVIYDWICNFKVIVQIKYNNSEYRENWMPSGNNISIITVYLHVMRFNVKFNLSFLI
jgi:hypothetical protein